MATIFEKLNLKQQRDNLVVNAPQSFEPELSALQGVNLLRHSEHKKQEGNRLSAARQKIANPKSVKPDAA